MPNIPGNIGSIRLQVRTASNTYNSNTEDTTKDTPSSSSSSSTQEPIPQQSTNPPSSTVQTSAHQNSYSNFIITVGKKYRVRILNKDGNETSEGKNFDEAVIEKIRSTFEKQIQRLQTATNQEFLALVKGNAQARIGRDSGQVSYWDNNTKFTSYQESSDSSSCKNIKEDANITRLFKEVINPQIKDYKGTGEVIREIYSPSAATRKNGYLDSHINYGLQVLFRETQSQPINLRNKSIGYRSIFSPKEIATIHTCKYLQEKKYHYYYTIVCRGGHYIGLLVDKAKKKLYVIDPKGCHVNNENGTHKIADEKLDFNQIYENIFTEEPKSSSVIPLFLKNTETMLDPNKGVTEIIGSIRPPVQKDDDSTYCGLYVLQAIKDLVLYLVDNDEDDSLPNKSEFISKFHNKPLEAIKDHIKSHLKDSLEYNYEHRQKRALFRN